MTKKYDGLESEIGYVREDASQKKTALHALEKIITMYSSQIQQIDKILNQILLKKNQAISSTRLLAASLMPVMAVRAPNDNTKTTNDEGKRLKIKLLRFIFIKILNYFFFLRY
jgi:hypothetical protein